MKGSDEMLNSRQWSIYKYLRNNCVGKENMKHGFEICKALGIEKSNFKKDIRAIRNADVITRRIGSTPKGYWLMLEEENGLDYIKQLTLTHLKTAVKQVIPTQYFHQVLNDLENDIVLNNQTRLTFTPHEHETIRKYSDDLKGV